ncbi:MAG: DUF123 domain-containing protein [Ardenticatenaceae bacterium]|nr:DUF123 domain-containing protein [Ardenticatenaceae bacterium]
MTFRDEHFCCWGSQAQGGTYLLLLTVAEPLAVRFGRFQNGRSLPVAPGDYFYVGSALAAKGSTSLARRLLRHASRGDGQNPHAIRARMLQLFPQIGLGPAPLLPPASKKLRWHVDFLLEETAVTLKSVYFIRESTAGLGLETAVARFLLSLPTVAPLAVGLGSTDDPGSTHLLRIEADADWWSAFPERLTAFLQGVAT